MGEIQVYFQRDGGTDAQGPHIEPHWLIISTGWDVLLLEPILREYFREFLLDSVEDGISSIEFEISFPS